MKKLLLKILMSKKFIYTIVGVIVTLLHEKFGIDPAMAQQIAYGIIALVIGQGMADFGKEK